MQYLATYTNDTILHLFIANELTMHVSQTL